MKTEGKHIINTKDLWMYSLIALLFWASGYIFRNYYGFFTLAVFMGFFLLKRYTAMILVAILWTFISPYFTAINLLDKSSLNAYLNVIPSLILIYVFAFRIPIVTKNRFVIWIVSLHVLLIVVFLFAYYLFTFSPLRIFSYINCFLLFFAIVLTNFQSAEYKKILTMVFSIGIIQIPVSYGQFFGILEAPSYSVSETTFSVRSGVSGLDDIACGTFGSISSGELSFFLSILSILMLIFFLLQNNKTYLVFSFFYLLQYAITDSKTQLFITLIILAGVFGYHLFLWKRLTSVLNAKIIIGVLIFIAGISIGIKKYYDSGLYAKRDSEYYKEYVIASITKVASNLDKWGKITGFGQVYEIQRNKLQSHTTNLVGLGPWEYTYVDYGFRLRRNSRLTVYGYANSFVDPRSGFITIFAETGFMGMLAILGVFGCFFFFGRFVQTSDNPFIDAVIIISKGFVLGSLLYGFLHISFKYYNLPMLAFWIFLAISLKYAEIEREEKFVSLNPEDTQPETEHESEKNQLNE